MSDSRENVAEAPRVTAQPAPADAVQPACFLLELSRDWIVQRASQNIHHLFGESHVTLIDEPLGRFVHAQALHDLRNLFSRLSGTTGIARAYRVRLTDRPILVDIAFQLSGSRVLLEAVPSATDGFGEAFGTVGGLVTHLSGTSGQALRDAAARCMRALTGYDRVILDCGGHAESNRARFAATAPPSPTVPTIVCDCAAQPVPLFPHRPAGSEAKSCLMRMPSATDLDQLREDGVAAAMVVPVTSGGRTIGHFHCHSRTARAPSFELHAAAELFAQMFAMQVELDELRGRPA